MAKRKPVTENLEEEMLKEVWKIAGSTAASLDGSLAKLHGVPLERNLPLQYILGMDALPLHRIYSTVGSWASTKSAFCDELCIRFQRFGGRCVYMDNEKKKNPYQTLGQFKWMLNRDNMKDVKVAGIAQPIPRSYTLVYPNDLDTMLKSLVAFLKTIKEFVKKDPSIADQPWLLVVDSLYGLTNAAALNDILKGEDPNNIANVRNAASIKYHIQAINTLTFELPVAIIMVNELAEKENTGIDIGGRAPAGPSKFRTREVGGKFKDFAYSGNFMNEKLDASKTNADWILGKDLETPHIRMNMKKSCFGVQRDNPIVVPYRSMYREQEGEWDSNSLLWYDWDASLTHLLHKTIGPQALAEHFDLVCRNGFYESKAFGLAGLTATEFGRALHANPDVVKFLQDNVLHIQRIAKIREEPDPDLALPLGRDENGGWPENDQKACLPGKGEAVCSAADVSLETV